MTDYEKLNLVFQVVSTLLIVWGLVYAGRQFRLTHETESRNTLLRTLDYIEKVAGTIQEPMQNLYSQAEHMQNIEPKNQLGQNALFVLNKLEGVAQRIKLGAYPEHHIQNSWGGYIVRCFRLLEPFILRRRAESCNPNLWVELEYFVARWERLP